jgi:hypothetical protein
VRKSEGDGDGEDRTWRSMIGREENEVVMMKMGVLDRYFELYLCA